MPGKITACCLLGSNLGDRLGLLRRAAFALAATEGIEIARASAVYETPPWGVADQPSFLNAAVALHTALQPEALLDRFQEIERHLGRERQTGERWGPRLVDLDLALYGEQVIRTPRLTVPHPHLTERLFALIPLLEIAPSLRDPATGIPYSKAAEELRIKDEKFGVKREEEKDPRGPQPEPEILLKEPLIWEAASLNEIGREALGRLVGGALVPEDERLAETGATNAGGRLAEDGTTNGGGRPAEDGTTNGGGRPAEAGTTNGEPSPALLFQSDRPEDTERLAEDLGRRLKGGEALALSGNLGAGKTCFARGLARGLGIQGPVTSPSYVLVKSYEGRLTLHHGDFYRLAGAETYAPPDDGKGGWQSLAPAGGGAKNAKNKQPHPNVLPEPPDLASLGLEDYLDDPGAVILIEWADRYPDWLEPPFYLIEIEGAGDAPRMILMRRIGRWE